MRISLSLSRAECSAAACWGAEQSQMCPSQQGCPKGPLQEEAEVVLGTLWSLRAALEEPARAGGHRDVFRELSLLCKALAGAVPRQRGQIPPGNTAGGGAAGKGSGILELPLQSHDCVCRRAWGHDRDTETWDRGTGGHGVTGTWGHKDTGTQLSGVLPQSNGTKIG